MTHITIYGNTDRKSANDITCIVEEQEVITQHHNNVPNNPWDEALRLTPLAMTNLIMS